MYDAVIISYEKNWPEKGFDGAGGMGIMKMSLRVADHKVEITHVSELFRIMNLASTLGINDCFEYEASYYYNTRWAYEPVYLDGTGTFEPASMYFRKLLEDSNCAQHMAFRSIRWDDQGNIVQLASSPAGSEETLFNNDVLNGNMDDVADVEVWGADVLEFSICFPDDTAEEITQRIMQKMINFCKKYFTQFNLHEVTPLDIDGYLETYGGKHRLELMESTNFTPEKFKVFCEEVQDIAQIVISAKGTFQLKGEMLSYDTKNPYAVAYLEMDGDGKVQISAAKM